MPAEGFNGRAIITKVGRTPKHEQLNVFEQLEGTQPKGAGGKAKRKRRTEEIKAKRRTARASRRKNR